jgi:hypothetical protein
MRYDAAQLNHFPPSIATGIFSNKSPALFRRRGLRNLIQAGGDLSQENECEAGFHWSAPFEV